MGRAFIADPSYRKSAGDGEVPYNVPDKPLFLASFNHGSELLGVFCGT